jgi:hypothetical protein
LNLRRAFTIALLLAVTAPAARAQRADAAISGLVVPEPAVVSQPASADSTAAPKRIRIGPISILRRDSSWWVPLTSTIVPGTGQALLGQHRFIAYLAVEAFTLLGYVNQENEAARERDRYRELASDVARAAFPGAHPVGPWAYYESMEHYLQSGVFNRLPGGDLFPESDSTTFNGAMWALARRTYWQNPDVQPATNSAAYQNAINLYIARAVRPEYSWSWSNAQLSQDLYRRSIDRANQAYRDARTQLGWLIANHLLSTVDAFVTLRLRGGAGATAAAGPNSMSASIPWAPFGRSGAR